MTRTRWNAFDFRGGCNLAFSEDTLDQTELRRARNARMGEYGSIAKRAGSQRVHDTALADDVLGLYQWQPAAGRQLVAIADTDLHHKLADATDFTTVSGTLSTSVAPDFAPHIIAGVPTLFIADGTLRKWTGSALSAVSGAPDALRVAVYKTRMFAIDGTKTIYWSAVSNPEVWASPDGGQAFVETYDAAGLVALEVVGASLLLFKQNSIARFTGVSAADIRIDQETEGISADIGTIAPGTVLRMQDTVFFLSDRGPYEASEAGVRALGVKVEPAFQDVDLSDAVAVHHKARREVWVFVGEDREGWVYNYRTGSWTGPWDGLDVVSAAEFELEDLTENVVLGGADGRVRLGDVPAVGALDDVVRAGTGGTAITMVVEPPVLLFGDPTAVKTLKGTQQIAADLGTAGSLAVSVKGTPTTAQTATLATRGAGAKQYLFRPGTMGDRLTMTLTDETAEIVQINGLTLEAEMGRRGV